MKKLLPIALLSYFPVHAMNNELSMAALADPITIRELIMQGSDVNKHYRDGRWTLLHFAARDKRCNAIVQELLDHGAHVNVQNRDGWMPLHLAVFNMHRHVIMVLLDHGADVNAQLPDGSTPLHLAICNDSRDIITLLLNRGADMNIKNKIGETAYARSHDATRTTMDDFIARFTKIKGIPTAEGSQ